ncbi:hypothetical protein LVD15_03155 [Fulvivirga maritima]|uniref:hypothetical protein n=1 Tax=Fulvivirga maritima TaxID=2904247 RepID=UPI001F2E1D3C|nr:hypothetical protein [Fulvivirga maritima]UII27444.1 hypothetical protein LVD15_03155 [Fulvivirga maritima]
MAKRQLRLSPDLISEKWSEISGKKANIVLNNRRVIFVKLIEHSADQIKVEDMKQQKHKVDTKEISEIILDIKA